MVLQGLVTEVARRPTATDDTRRRYYRLTPFGHACASAEVRRMSELLRLARRRGVTQEAS